MGSMTNVSGSVLAVLLCVSGSVAAHDCAPLAPPGRFGTHAFERSDRNRDGMVTREEWVGDELQRFDTFDTNRDGVVGADEAKVGHMMWRERRFEQRFRELDRNGDGVLAPGELGMSPRRFAELDRNRDRRLSPDELRATYVSKKPRGTSGWLEARWDVNGDRILTRAEARELADKRFSVADQNRDGALSPGELRAESQKRAEARRRGRNHRRDPP